MKVKKTIVLDQLDKRIIKNLLQDARTSTLDIARQEGLSGTAIHKRLNKLEKIGIIKGSSVFLNMNLLNYKMLFFTGIYLEKAVNSDTVTQKLLKIPEVLECHHVSGRWNVLVKILCKDSNDMSEVLKRKIQPIEGVKSTETLISFNQSVESLCLAPSNFESLMSN